MTFDVQTTHARPYRARPGLRSDVFKYDCNQRPAYSLAAEQDCNEVLVAAVVAEAGDGADGEVARSRFELNS